VDVGLKGPLSDLESALAETVPPGPSDDRAANRFLISARREMTTELIGQRRTKFFWLGRRKIYPLMNADKRGWGDPNASRNSLPFLIAAALI